MVLIIIILISVPFLNETDMVKNTFKTNQEKLERKNIHRWLAKQKQLHF